MRQTINISLAGVAFSVETEGYNKLKNYLLSIEQEYENPLEAKELTGDIETRIAELILNRQSSNTPVTEETINSIIAQLGFPIDEEHHKKQSTPPPPYQESRKIAHRLYRNTDGAMLGGVCSGVATYFNIDVVIIRLLLLLPLFITIITLFFHARGFFISMNFSMVILYVILWIVIPKARTPRQMLEMQGEQVTKENMERFIKDEMFDIDANLTRITRSEKSATLLSSLINIFGLIIKFFLYFIGTVVIVGICIFISVGLGYVIYGATACSTFFSTLFYGNIYLNAITGIIICLIPIIILLLVPIRPIFKVYPKRPFYIIVSSIWLIAIIYGSVVATKSLLRFRSQNYFDSEIKMPIKGGTLHIKNLNSDSYYPKTLHRTEIDEDMLVSRDIYVNQCDRHLNTDSVATIKLSMKAYGKSSKEAYDKARTLQIDYRIEGDTIFVDRHFKIKSSDDLFNECDVQIHLPSHLQYIDQTR